MHQLTDLCMQHLLLLMMVRLINTLTNHEIFHICFQHIHVSVVFVIDAGRVKENRYDDLNKMPTLTECWVSKASAKQRRGRAGRVKPGFCWHLYSSHSYNNQLAEYQMPEMLRVGLEDLG